MEKSSGILYGTAFKKVLIHKGNLPKDPLIYLRETCLFCVCKHISQAQVLLDESCLGYPDHKWLAIGHLAEAESESVEYFPEFAQRIRNFRVNLMEQDKRDCDKKLMDILHSAIELLTGCKG